MAVTVYIPTPFRRATNNRDRLQASARSVGALLDELEGTFAGLKGLVRNEGGELHHHVNIYVNSEAIESLMAQTLPEPPAGARCTSTKSPVASAHRNAAHSAAHPFRTERTTYVMPGQTGSLVGGGAA